MIAMNKIDLLFFKEYGKKCVGENDGRLRNRKSGTKQAKTATSCCRRPHESAAVKLKLWIMIGPIKAHE